MNPTIDWKVINLERYTEGGIVYRAYYGAFLTEGDYTVETTSSVAFAAPEGDYELIPFEDLTETIVLNWIFSTLTAAEMLEIRSDLESQLALLATPPTSTGLPWAE